ncbi:MAG TPA: histone deacetylase [Chitinivibrionales bacterium]|nr:histone deacetylase [Chitinivibrionales bacterium]
MILKKTSTQKSSPPLSVQHVTGYVFEDACMGYELDFGHPESPERLAAIKAKMAQTGLDKKVLRLSPLDDVVHHIRKIHTDGHIKSIQGIRTIGPIAELAVGGALAAVKAVCEGTARNAFCAMRPPGHHALNTGQEEGFCFYNNVAIAAKYAQQVCKKPKILIVDWDFHHGNGTEAAFYTDPTMLYFSTHYALAYPGTGFPEREGEGAGRGFNINVHMPAGSGDEDFVKVFNDVLVPRADTFKPDFVFISAGFDGRADDKLGCFAISDEGFAALTRIVMDIAHKHCGDRIVSVLEGGYTPEDLAGAVCAHMKTLLGYDPK